MAQFKSGLADALRPFSNNPKHQVGVLTGNYSDGQVALMAFLQRGQFVDQETTYPLLCTLRWDLGDTISRILDGREVWSLDPDDLEDGSDE